MPQIQHICFFLTKYWYISPNTFPFKTNGNDSWRNINDFRPFLFVSFFFKENSSPILSHFLIQMNNICIPFSFVHILFNFYDSTGVIPIYCNYQIKTLIEVWFVLAYSTKCPVHVSLWGRVEIIICLSLVTSVFWLNVFIFAHFISVLYDKLSVYRHIAQSIDWLWKYLFYRRNICFLTWSLFCQCN